ncbi:MAG: hypothetical protein LBP19_04625 [Treponema sp.]|nr:hypothetical protein [Treponema sp.]
MNLGKINDGVTIAHIFVNPPVSNMALSVITISRRILSLRRIKSPRQSSEWEAREVITFNMNSSGAGQITWDGRQNRTCTRSRHVDNNDFSL